MGASGRIESQAREKENKMSGRASGICFRADFSQIVRALASGESMQDMRPALGSKSPHCIGVLRIIRDARLARIKQGKARQHPGD